MKAILCERDLPKTRWTEVLPISLFAYRNEKHSTTGFTPSELFLAFRVKDLSLPPISNRYIDTSHFATAAGNIARRRNAAARRFRHKDRYFPRGSEVLVKAPTVGKLDLPGEAATVVEQVDEHTAEVVLGNGRTDLVSTARMSPLPPNRSHSRGGPAAEGSPGDASRPWRERRTPSYLEDYELS